MQERIPQSVAKRVVFKAFLSADHVTAAGEALTVPVQISKNGGTFANLATPANATHIDPHGCGWYYIDLAVADTDTLGPLIVRGTEGTIDPVELICEVVAPTNAGFTALPAVVAGAASGLPLKDASNFLNVANIPAAAAGAAGGLAIVGSQMIVPDTQKVDLNTIKTQAVTCSAGVTVLASVGTAATSTAQTGDSYAIVNHATYGNSKLVRTGADGDTAETLSDQIDILTGGGGATSDTITVNDAEGSPLDGVDVWITSDNAGVDSGTKVAGSKYTDSNGEVTFQLDDGTYWLHCQLAGQDFTTTYPKKMTVAGGAFAWA